MPHMGNGEVRWKNRHGVTENQVFVSIDDSSLTIREVIEA
jgi:hypothetical protein